MADPLPYQLQDARAAEQYAKWRLMELTSPSTQAHTHDHHSSSGEDFNTRPGAMLTYEAPTSKFPVPDQNGPQLHHLQPPAPRRHGYTDSPTHPQGQVPQNGAGQMVSKHAPACHTVADHQVHSVRMGVWDVSGARDVCQVYTYLYAAVKGPFSRNVSSVQCTGFLLACLVPLSWQPTVYYIYAY